MTAALGFVKTVGSERGSKVLVHGLVDIAVNLTDPVFRGVDYKGRRVHDDDFDLMMERSAAVGVEKMIITGTSYRQSIAAIELCRRYPDRLRCTVGVHPAHCQEFESPDSPHSATLSSADDAIDSEMDGEKRAAEHLAKVVRLIEENRDVVVAVGEIGLDYAELSMCPREVQHKYFRKQLWAFADLGLPFLFHSRECGNFFVDALDEFIQQRRESCVAAAAAAALGAESKSATTTTTSSNINDNDNYNDNTNNSSMLVVRGVVHSFNGTAEEQQRLLDMGLLLSVNGSAFRTQELASQVARIPLDRLLLETDAPWCDIRKKDYGYDFVQTHMETNKRGKPFVMGKCLERRNEPCHLVQVMEAFLGAANAKETEEEVKAGGGTNTEKKDKRSSRSCATGESGLTAEVLVEHIQRNCEQLFGWGGK